MSETILLLGKGGREHAFACKISESKLCSKLYIAPGNPGTAQCGTNVAIDYNNFEALAEFALIHKVSMLVVGPEDPLVHGIWEYFQQEHLKHITVIGPSKEGARLEGSKDYAKAFMMQQQIPTAAYQSFTKNEFAKAVEFVNTFNGPVVLKADGLAAGKGVVICQTKEEAIKELNEFLNSEKFGAAGSKVVIEEFLYGIELSVFILTDGKDYLILPTAKDYKRIGEGDTGLNTGGMGAVSPVPFADGTLMQKVEERIIRPTLAGLQKDNTPYTGFIYFGLMNVKGEPFVIEYNCRLGDPETEVVLPRIENDLVELFQAAANRKLNTIKIKHSNQHGVTIVLAAAGYPGTPETGKVITQIDLVKDAFVYHAGTTIKDHKLISNGGRVIALTSLGNNLTDALQKANQAAATITFDGKYFRRDIGFEFN
jgi:phosphoribosylamine--glycine ligase